jgi:hypothetical protein
MISGTYMWTFIIFFSSFDLNVIPSGVLPTIILEPEALSTIILEPEELSTIKSEPEAYNCVWHLNEKIRRNRYVEYFPMMFKI